MSNRTLPEAEKIGSADGYKNNKNSLSFEKIVEEQISLFGEEGYNWEYNINTPEYVKKELYAFNKDWKNDKIVMLKEISEQFVIFNHNFRTSKNTFRKHYGMFVITSKVVDDTTKYTLYFFGTRHWANVCYKSKSFEIKSDHITTVLTNKKNHNIQVSMVHKDDNNNTGLNNKHKKYYLEFSSAPMNSNESIRAFRGRSSFEQNQIYYWNKIEGIKNIGSDTNSTIDTDTIEIINSNIIDMDKDIEEMFNRKDFDADKLSSTIKYYDDITDDEFNLMYDDEQDLVSKKDVNVLLDGFDKPHKACSCDECYKVQLQWELIMWDTVKNDDNEDKKNEEDTKITLDIDIDIDDIYDEDDTEIKENNTITYSNNDQNILIYTKSEDNSINWQHNCTMENCNYKGCIALSDEGWQERLYQLNNGYRPIDDKSFECERCNIDIIFCDCVRLNICPFGYCDRYHDNELTCEDKKALDNVTTHYNNDNHSQGNITVIGEDDIIHDIYDSNSDTFNYQEQSALLTLQEYNNRVNNYFQTRKMFYTTNEHNGKYVQFGQQKKIRKRGTHGRERPQNEFYRNRARRFNNLTRPQIQNNEDEEYLETKNIMINRAGYLYHLLMHGDYMIFNSELESTTKNNKEVFDNMIFLLKLEFNSHNDELKAKINELIIKIENYKSALDNDTDYDYRYNKTPIDAEIFENTRAQEELARAWARFQHSYNGNIETKLIDMLKEIDSTLIGSCADKVIKKYGTDEINRDIELYVKEDHVEDQEFEGYTSKITYANMLENMTKGYKYANDKTKEDDERKRAEEEEKKEREKMEKMEKELQEKNRKEEKLIEQQKTQIEKNKNNNTDTISSKQITRSSSYTISDNLKQIPIEGAIDTFFDIMYGNSDKDRRADSWSSAVYGVNYVHYKQLRRESLFYKYNNTSHVSMMVPFTHPTLNRVGRNQGDTLRWTYWGEIDMHLQLYRISQSRDIIGSKMVVSKMFSELYEKLDSGGDLSYFRSFFGTRFQHVLTRGLLQSWVLQSKHLSLKKTSDVARWLTLFLRAQQQSDVIDKNVFLQTCDLQLVGTQNRPVKIRTRLYADPNQNALPKLFPLLTDDQTTLDGQGNRVLPAYTIKFSDFMKYIVLGENLEGNTFGQWYTIDDIMSGKVGVVFVHPYMAENRNAMTEYTQTHMSHPLFHWSYRLSATTVDYVDIGGGHGLGSYNQASWNTGNVDNNGNQIINQQFDAVIQSNDVRVDGASKGVLFVRTTDFLNDIRLGGNTNITMAMNYIIPAGGNDGAIDIKGTLINYQTQNLEGTSFMTVAGWLNKETGNLNDYMTAWSLFTNYAHVVGTPIIERQSGNYLKWFTTGQLATASVTPVNWPDGANAAVNRNLWRNVKKANGDREPNTDLENTISAYRLIQNPLGQRKRYFNNIAQTNNAYDSAIPIMDIYEKVALMIGTHDIENKIDLNEYISRTIFEIVVDGKDCAKCLTKATDLILQSTDIPYSELLIPRNAPRNVYSNILEQRYYNGEHPFSREMIDLYDIITNNSITVKWQDKLYYSGQFSTTYVLGQSADIKEILKLSKWSRELQTLGYNNNDHIDFTNDVDILWQNKAETLQVDGQHALRWRKQWSYKWNESETLEWTRLNAVVIPTTFTIGYCVTRFPYQNYIDKENNSWSSVVRFNNECGLLYYEQSNQIEDWLCKPYGNKQLFYDESTNNHLYIGTIDSIIPWTQQTQGYLLTSVGSDVIDKYDINAPSLITNPSKSTTKRFL